VSTYPGLQGGVHRFGPDEVVRWWKLSTYFLPALAELDPSASGPFPTPIPPAPVKVPLVTPPPGPFPLGGPWDQIVIELTGRRWLLGKPGVYRTEDPADQWIYTELRAERVERLFRVRGIKVPDSLGQTDGPEGERLPVILGDVGSKPTIRGVEVDPLTPARHAVITALLNVWPKGLTKDKLATESGHGDAVNLLKQIRKSSPLWKSVILLPGKTGRGLGYRIAPK
jgi:hypothetical protein